MKINNENSNEILFWKTTSRDLKIQWLISNYIPLFKLVKG